jgi:hypothetical protein
MNNAELELAENRIKNAYIGGVIIGAVTLLFTIVAITYGDNMLGLDAWALLDVVLIFGLTFGVYKKSRVCAVLLFLYFVVSKIILFMETGKPVGLIVAFIFGYHLFRGAQGTITYHKVIRYAER